MSSVREELKHFRGTRKWVSELAGLPTYLGAALLTISTVRSFLLGTGIFFCIVMIYHVVYSYLFPQFEFRSRLPRLAGFVLVQVVLWIALLWGAGAR
jgi:hypothetical protein